MKTLSLSEAYRLGHRFLVRLFGGKAPRIGLEVSTLAHALGDGAARSAPASAVALLYDRRRSGHPAA